MKKSALYLIAAIALSVTFYSCKCHDVQCAAFDTEHWNWLYIQQGDALVFQDKGGNSLSFVMSYKSQTEAYISRPIASEFGGCANEPCDASGVIYGSDSLGGRILTLRYRLWQNTSNKELKRVYYDMDDFSDDILIPYQLEDTDDGRFERHMANEVQLGSHTYSQVQVIERKPSGQQFHIQKVYFAEHYGVIAFEDSIGSLYYLR